MRERNLAAVVGCLLALLAVPPADAQTEPDSVSSFLGGLGINSHIAIKWSTDYPYTPDASGNPVFSPLRLGQFEAALQYLGINTLRETVSADPTIDAAFPGPNGTRSIWQRLGLDIGIKFDFTITGQDGSLGDVIRHASILKFVEGPNEVDNDDWLVYPPTPAIRGIAAAKLMAPIIYGAIKGTAATSAVPVVQYSIGNQADLPQTGSVSAAYADGGNAHIYFGTGNPPGGGNTIASLVDAGRTMTPGKPVVATEAGYATMPGDVHSVSPNTQAEYLLSLLLDIGSRASATL